MSEEPRDRALEFLYAHETHGDMPSSQGRVEDLVEGILANLESLDSQIEEVSEHWTVSRMPVLDRNILRIALYELEHDREVPTGVIISEAVRLASTYSTEKSSAFVNGLLSTLAQHVRPAGGN
jgi:transcription antitermination protein NusB